MPTSDESRYFEKLASLNDDEPDQSMKMKFFDVDSYGCMYQKESESLVSGLDRMNSTMSGYSVNTAASATYAGGIYLGKNVEIDLYFCCYIVT